MPKASRYKIYSTEPSKWGLTKKNQLYFAKWNDGIIVKLQKWYDGASLMVFTREKGYGIKLRETHIAALISYLSGDLDKVREIINHKNDLEYLEELEDGIE